MTKLLSAIIVFFVLIFGFSVSVSFASENSIISCEITDNSACYFDKTNGELTIDGYGMIWTGRILSEDLHSVSVKTEDIKKLIIRDGITIFDIGVLFSSYDENVRISEITLPKSIKKIDGGFGDFLSLKTINYGGTKAEWDKIIGSDNEALSEYSFNYSVDVPKSSEGLSGKGNEIRTEILNKNISCIYNYITEELVISGTGELKTDGENFPLSRVMFTSDNPYNNDYVRFVRFKDIVINEGITKLCEGDFEYENANSITIPKSIKKIEKSCFGTLADDEKSTLEVYYAGSKADWDKIKIGEYNEILTKGNIHFSENVSTDNKKNENSLNTACIVLGVSAAVIMVCAITVYVIIKNKKNKQ